MWPAHFEHRLRDWNKLRDRCDQSSLHDSLMDINDWWFRAPMVNRYLHWDDWARWPNPWQLLADDYYCDVARALGMLYTIKMSSLAHVPSSLIQTDSDILVLIDQGKYIVNWCPGQVLNIDSNPVAIKKQLESRVFDNKIG